MANMQSLGLAQMLYTHAGTIAGANSTLYLDWNKVTFDNNTGRSVTFNYSTNNSRVLVIQYLPYTAYIKVSQPIKVSSKAKLRSTVKVNKYELVSPLNTDKAQSRSVLYEAPSSYNLYTTTRTVRVSSLLAQEIKTQNSIVRKTLGGLPLTKAYVYDVNRTLDNYTSLQNAIAKLNLPAIQDGLLPADLVNIDMNSKTPLGIAWGLLLACAAKNDFLAIQILKGLVAEALNRGHILLNSDGVVEVNASAYWGFEANFVPGAAVDDTKRDIGDNAFLGWAICNALRYLQDRLPLDSCPLDGAYSAFKPALLQLLLSIGYLCAYAVSPVSWWACERFEDGAFNYESVSQRASYLSSVFLNELLQFKYDVFIHNQAARLFLAIDSAPEDLQDSYYSIFPDTSNQALVYKALWLWKYELDYSSLMSLYEQEETTDPLAAYLLAQLDSIPNWVTTFVVTYLPIANGSVEFTVSSSIAVPAYLIDKEYSLKSSKLFDLYAKEAEAKVTYTLQELRRLWPVGYRWGDPAIISSITSVLGSLLYAESSLYFDYFTLFFLLTSARALDLAQGDFARNWVSSFLNVEACATDYYLRDWTYQYVNRDYSTKTEIASLLSGIYGYPNSSITYNLPKPFSLRLDHTEPRDDYAAYSEEVNTFNGEYFNEQQLFSIVYKSGATQDISFTGDLISDSSLVNDFAGNVPRAVAGIPYRNVLVSDSSFLCSSDVLVNQEYSSIPTVERLMYPPGALISDTDYDLSQTYWINEDRYVLDGCSVMLKPLSKFIPLLQLNLGGALYPHLHEYLTNTIADGVSYVVKAFNYNVNDSDVFYIIPIPVSDDWRFDDLHRMQNDIYTEN